MQDTIKILSSLLLYSILNADDVFNGQLGVKQVLLVLCSDEVGTDSVLLPCKGGHYITSALFFDDHVV